MRPIDADAVKGLIRSGISVDTYADQDYVCELVDDIPTIDAVSVVHGEWMPNPKIGWGETWVCSICGEKTTSSLMGYPRYNYCPMCGARMKGANDEMQ